MAIIIYSVTFLRGDEKYNLSPFQPTVELPALDMPGSSGSPTESLPELVNDDAPSSSATSRIGLKTLNRGVHQGKILYLLCKPQFGDRLKVTPEKKKTKQKS